MDDKSSQKKPFALDEKMKRMIMDLQRHWLSEYQQSREKLLVEITEKVGGRYFQNFSPSRMNLVVK